MEVAPAMKVEGCGSDRGHKLDFAACLSLWKGSMNEHHVQASAWERFDESLIVLHREEVEVTCRHTLHRVVVQLHEW
jgi:hypothetical protein